LKHKHKEDAVLLKKKRKEIYFANNRNPSCRMVPDYEMQKEFQISLSFPQCTTLQKHWP
jgi:hypothetical protein